MEPRVEYASDALDRLIMANAEEYGSGLGCPCDVVVVDDHTGALTAWAVTYSADENGAFCGGRVLVRCTSRADAARAVTVAESLGEAARHNLLVAGIDSPELGLEEFLQAIEADAHLVVGRLPKSLAALDDVSRAIARHRSATGGSAELFLGGATKHMTRSMNEVLFGSFEHVSGLRGKGKFRCLHAEGPKDNVLPHEGERSVHGGGQIVGLGGVFAGGKPDRGGVFLSEQLRAELGALSQELCAVGEPLRVVDLGCGNGTVSLALHEAATSLGVPLQIVATDLDADAVRSSGLTLRGIKDARVDWDNAGSRIEDDWANIVALNPPFHAGTRVDATLVQPLLSAAQRILAPGGELYFVHNSHLRYRSLLEQAFASVEQVARNRLYTVLRARKMP